MKNDYEPKNRFEQFVISKLISIEKEFRKVDRDRKRIDALEDWKAKIIGALVIINIIGVPLIIKYLVE